jgi:periplasmic divalent cation tolerance protein
MSSLLVLTACPDHENASHIAKTLVQEKLAACVNILSGVQSVYRWHDAIEETREVLLLIKSTPEKYPELEAKIHSLHPYEVPEVLAVTADRISHAYQAWLTGACLTNI